MFKLQHSHYCEFLLCIFHLPGVRHRASCLKSFLIPHHCESFCSLTGENVNAVYYCCCYHQTCISRVWYQTGAHIVQEIEKFNLSVCLCCETPLRLWNQVLSELEHRLIK